QTTGAQFTVDGFYGTQIQGDSIVLLPVGYVEDTVLSQNFESADIPAGWTVIDGNSDGNEWEVGTTGDLSSYVPPSYGTQYAYYSDDDAGSGVINNNEELISPAIYIPGAASGLAIEYGYGFQQYQSGETYDVRARFFNGSWGSWTTIASYTSSDNGTQSIDLTSYLPADSVQFEWMYHDETSASHWGWACACDNVIVTYSYTFTNDDGTVTGVPADYSNLTALYFRPHWGQARWHKADPQDSIGIQVEYYNGAWQLIPDVHLAGNSGGFFTTSDIGNVSLSGLDTMTYGMLRLVGMFQRINPESPTDPALLDWELGNLSNVETVPPEPFGLIAPLDSAISSDPRPSFLWHSTTDAGSGLRDYRVYIGGVLRHTGNDTSWAADYDLVEGYNDWYVVAYDSANNARNSNETWTVIVDTTAPPAVSLITPVNNSYLNGINVNFVWHEANDNVSGIQHYILQYALNSSFTQGLVETTWVDTSFTANLPDTTYYWRVSATDRADNVGSFSGTWQFEVDTQLPSTPTLVTPTGGNWLIDTLVDFQWSTVTAIIGGHNQSPDFRAPIRYVLQIDITTSFSSPVYVDTFATPSTTVTLAEDFYYWRVMAYDLAGNQGPFSNIDSFGVDVTTPSTVSLITPTDNGYLSNSAIDFTWYSATDNLSGVDHYFLQYALNSSFTQGLVETTLVDTVCTAVLSETTYYWHVMAVDVAGNQGAFSTTWQFEVDTQSPTVPALVTPIGGIWYSEATIDFEWSPVARVSGNGQGGTATHPDESPALPLSPIRYIIQIDTSDLFSAPLVVDTFATNTTTISLAESFYYWQVKAYDLAGNQGAYSAPDSVGVDITAPSVESTTVWNDTIYLGPFEIMTKVTDGWSGVDSVHLYYKRDQDPNWMCAAMGLSGPDWYVDTIPAVALSGDSVRYYIEAADMAQPANSVVDPTGAPTSYYGFVASVTGIAELIEIPFFFSFNSGHNPARGKVMFSLAIPANAQVELCIFDVSGRLVARPIYGQLSAGNYDVQWKPEFSAGIYFYSLNSPWENRSGKIVLMK
ncbi:hypothetical protein KAS45_04495, partial [candidate division WOR-3 bacterium]|nr:hypothetical protein [candidate division WOR-3 bacterium]